MSTFAQNHVQQLFIGAAATKTASGTLSDANTGEICILSPDGQILTQATAATAKAFKIGVNRGTSLDIVSDIIEKANITHYGVKTHAAATAQLDYIGYNGTSGSIEVNNNALYYVRLYMEDLNGRSSSDGKRLKFGAYKSTAAATQEAVARGITDSLIRNFSREAEEQIKFERICDEAGVALGTAVGPLTFTKGSKFFSADDINDATTNAALAVGDFIRAGVGLTDPVYEITAVNGDIGTLDIAFQGDNLTAVADTSFERITNAAALAAEWGIKLTGRALDYKLGKIKYKVSRFETQVDTTEGFNLTPITATVKATPGTGTVEQIQELEWFTQGHEGEFFRMGEPNIFDSRKDGTSAAGYDLIDIMFANNEVLGLGSLVSSSKHVTIATPETTPNYALNATTDDITDVLEVLCAGSADASLSLG
ncbi:MAG: hypothetical protein ACI9LF_001174 [Flavobacteriales bacterium]|jgi:hypothetical protein